MTRVLIVEDNAMNRKLMETILQANGYEWRSIAGGEDVPEALENESFDLVLMDLQMPGLDGFESLELVRADKVHKNIPVIAVTGNATESDKTHAINAGFAGFLSKPYRIDELLVLIRSFV